MSGKKQRNNSFALRALRAGLPFTIGILTAWGIDIIIRGCESWDLSWVSIILNLMGLIVGTLVGGSAAVIVQDWKARDVDPVE